MAFVYMLRCGDGSLYTGIAADLEKRLRDHVEKTPACARYTRSREVIELAMVWETTDLTAARRLEWAIHHATRPVKERLLAAPEQVGELFPKLAELRFVPLQDRCLPNQQK